MAKASISTALPSSDAQKANGLPPLFLLEAVQDTWLKKSLEPAVELPEDQRVFVAAGKRLPVVSTTEIQGNAHELVQLGNGAGQWHVFAPHYRRLQNAAPVAASAPAELLLPGAIDWTNFDAKVTASLSVGEVLQFDPRRRPRAQSSVIPRIIGTAVQFQAIRDAWGRPLGVTSFYRPEPINSQVGGVPNSFHVSGLAIDIYPIGLPLQSLYDFLRHRWTGGFGDGRNRGFLHLDRRDGGRFVPGGGVRPAVIWPY
jgi:hypothetical protein